MKNDEFKHENENLKIFKETTDYILQNTLDKTDQPHSVSKKSETVSEIQLNKEMLKVLIN